MSNAAYFPARESIDDDVEKHHCTSTDSLMSNSNDFLPLVPRQSKKHSLYRIVIISILMFSSCVLSFFVGKWWEGSQITQKCFERSSIRSPMKKDISPEIRLVRYNGTLNFKSPFRGQPSPTVDAAWDELDHVGFFPISEQEVIDIGSSLDAIRMPEEFGGGFMAQAEFTHKMHCLNYVRKSLFVNYDYYKDISIEYTDTPRVQRLHLEHCIEIMRQDIMCHADSGVFTAHWLDNYPRPYANFNVWKTCRNWEDVHNWAKSRAQDAPDDWMDLFVEGSVKWPRPPQPSQFAVPPPFL